MCNRSFESLSNDELKRIEKLMLPGKFSQTGFIILGDNILDIYNNDKNYISNKKITYDQIADVLGPKNYLC